MSVSYTINDHEVRSQLLRQIYTLRQHPHVVVSGTYRDLPTRELLHLSEDLTAALTEFENTKKRVIHNQIKVDKFMNSKFRHRRSEPSKKDKVLKTHTRMFLGQPLQTVDLIPSAPQKDPVSSLRAQVRTASFKSPAPFVSLEHLLQDGEELATITSALGDSPTLPDVLFLKRHTVVTLPEPVIESQEPTRKSLSSTAQSPELEITSSAPNQDLAIEEDPPQRYFTRFDEFADPPPLVPAASHEEVMAGPRVPIFTNLPVDRLTGTFEGDRFNTPFLDLSSFLADGSDLQQIPVVESIGTYLNPHSEVRPALLDIEISDLSGHVLLENAANENFDAEVSNTYSDATSRLADDYLFQSDEE